jgi:hypothetical protein
LGVLRQHGASQYRFVYLLFIIHDLLLIIYYKVSATAAGVRHDTAAGCLP